MALQSCVDLFQEQELVASQLQCISCWKTPWNISGGEHDLPFVANGLFLVM